MPSRKRPPVARLLCLALCFCLFGQSLVFAAPETIPVHVGKQTFQVTPGQWITVNQGSKVLHYNVRYMNGRPVALDESQYYQLVLGGKTAAQPVEKPLAAKISGTNRGIGSNLPPSQVYSTLVGVKPVPYAATDEGKIQKSSIRAGLTTAVKALGGKPGAPKSRPNVAPDALQETTPPSKLDVGLAKAGSKIKSGLDPKGILLRAGISVGVELATQIVRGEKPSAKKALAVVTSAEFAGNVVGSAAGAAAGSFMVPFLSAVPVIGGALSALAPTFGAVAGGSYGAYLAGDMKNGKFSLQEAFKRVNWVDVTGRSIGATIGGFLGATLFPPFGIYIGGILGGTLGAIVAKKLWGIFGGKSDAQVANQSISVPGSLVAANGPSASEDAVITLGTDDVSNAATSPVPDSDIRIPPAADRGETRESELTNAFAKYQELYELYKEKLANDSREEALKIGSLLNQAKSDYERLKKSNSR